MSVEPVDEVASGEHEQEPPSSDASNGQTPTALRVSGESFCQCMDKTTQQRDCSRTKVTAAESPLC